MFFQKTLISPTYFIYSVLVVTSKTDYMFHKNGIKIKKPFLCNDNLFKIIFLGEKLFEIYICMTH